MNRRGRPPYPDVLTPREWEVLELMREHLTNEEIASRLDISFATAKFHVSEIIGKLGVSGRREAATWQRDGQAATAHRWLAGLAPLLWTKRLPLAWLSKAAAAAALTTVAAGIALLAWGVLSNGLPADGDGGAITAISAGGDHTCVARSGSVWCWGGTPAVVSGVAGEVSAVSSGGWGSCALKDGGVWCWGFEPGSAASTPGCPVDVPCNPAVLMTGVEHGVSAISVGSNFGDVGNSNPMTCAIKDGGAWCLDTDPTDPSCATGDCTNTFKVAPGLERGIEAISMGDRMGCAVKDGGAWCWGSNWSGQLGNNSTSDSGVPEPVSGLASGVSAITAGDAHVCALKEGGVWCWGINRDGELGDNTTTWDPVPAPVPVAGLGSGVSAISAGGAHTCALKDGGVWCWGRNAAGQLGNNSTTDSAVPVAVDGLAGDVSAISAGGAHTCAVRGDDVSCWGRNDTGQLGNDRPARSDVPVAVSGLSSGVTAIEGTCALKNGGVWCWGANGNGQVGNNTTTDSAAPVAVSGLTSGVSAISVAYDLRCALKDGGAWCWGNNWAGQLGDGTTVDSPVPVAVSGLASGVTQIRAGVDQVCAVKDGDTWCWGSNRRGEFGAGSPVESHVPVLAPGSPFPRAARDVSGLCDLRNGGVECTVYPAGTATRQVVTGLESGVSDLAGSCALKDGGVSCFGIEGDFASVTAAEPVRGLGSGVTAITDGGFSTCALKRGGVWCGVGYGAGGQPIAMPGLASGVTAISGGDDNNICAIRDEGVWCWGSNNHGQLGNNSPADSLVPVPVRFPPPAAGPAVPSPAKDAGGHRTTYALAGVAAGVLAVAVAGGWALRRRRVG